MKPRADGQSDTTMMQPTVVEEGLSCAGSRRLGRHTWCVASLCCCPSLSSLTLIASHCPSLTAHLSLSRRLQASRVVLSLSLPLAIPLSVRPLPAMLHVSQSLSAVAISLAPFSMSRSLRAVSLMLAGKVYSECGSPFRPFISPCSLSCPLSLST